MMLLTLFLSGLLLMFLLALIVRPSPVKIPIENRHVFISGGSSGIGLAMARLAASDGARVSILARNRAKLEEARDYIRSSTGKEIAIYDADVRNFEKIRDAVEAAGPVDVLLCNQGVYFPQELENQDLDEIKFMIDVNLLGTINLIKAALPGMKNRRGSVPASIAFVSSQAGQVGIYGYAGYSASKFGLKGLAEALQHEVINYNIHVSLIFPPDTQTPGFVEENKRKPELTKIIAGFSAALEANDVAKKSLDGIKSGSFIVSCNFEGWLLALATAGLSPQRSFMTAFVEVVAAGIIRFVALCYQWMWYGIIARSYVQQRKVL